MRTNRNEPEKAALGNQLNRRDKICCTAASVVCIGHATLLSHVAPSRYLHQLSKLVLHLYCSVMLSVLQMPVFIPACKCMEHVGIQVCFTSGLCTSASEAWSALLLYTLQLLRIRFKLCYNLCMCRGQGCLVATWLQGKGLACLVHCEQLTRVTRCKIHTCSHPHQSCCLFHFRYVFVMLDVGVRCHSTGVSSGLDLALVWTICEAAVSVVEGAVVLVSKRPCWTAFVYSGLERL